MIWTTGFRKLQQKGWRVSKSAVGFFMDTTQLPPDFREFLKLLTEHNVEYLLIGGYAVGHFGYVRATADIDVWVDLEEGNADRRVAALKQIGFDVPSLDWSMFLTAERLIRMGAAPLHRDSHTDFRSRVCGLFLATNRNNT